MTGRREELVAGWLDASLSPAEQAELLEALRADAAFAREFAGEIEVHRGLQFSASQSEAGDRRAADRILHYVRASEEGARFADGVRQRARHSAAHPGTSMFGPAVAIAAAFLVAMLVGLLAFVSHRHRMAARPEIAERPEEEGREASTPPVRPEAPTAPPKPVEDEAARRRRIEEELRTAAGSNRIEAPPKPPEPKPAPEEKPVVTPRVDPPAKPEPTRVEAPVAVARVESVRGESTVAAGAELRDGSAIEAAAAVIKFADGTRVELAGEAKIHEKLSGKRATGKGITLARGSLSADVAKQPAGTAFLFVTPHAEVQVLGTVLSIQSGAETRVDVREGQVRVMSLKGGSALTLGPGQGSEVGASGLPRPFLQGLRAIYIDQNNFKGQALERVDPGIDLFLDSAKNELPPVGSDRNFAARWEGRFLAEAAGEYVFVLSVDGQARFTMDGQDLVSDPRGTFHPIERNTVRRKLAAGWHEVVVDYMDDTGSSRCELRYVPPGAPSPADGLGFAIPSRLFTHNRR